MKSNLDIAMFGHKRIPSREGGIEIVVEELCTRMVNKGNRVTCYNRAGHHVSGAEYDTKAAKEYKGIRLKKVPTIEKKGLAAVSSSFFAAIFAALGIIMWYIFMQRDQPFFAGSLNCFGKK